MATTLTEQFPPLMITITTVTTPKEAAHLSRSDLPEPLPAPPMQLTDWSLDIGLPLEGMGFRFVCDFRGIVESVVCEVHAENGTVDVDPVAGIDEQNDDDLDTTIKVWLTAVCPAIVRHLFAPLLTKGVIGE